MDPTEGVESHFKWLNELLPCISKHSLEVSGGSTESYIRSLLESVSLEEEESNYSRATDLCWKLNFAVQYAFVQDFESALKCIKMASDELEYYLALTTTDAKVVKPSESHVNAYKYLIETCSLAVINQMMKKHGLSNVDLGVQVEKFDLRWKQLNEDNKSKAALIFMKSCLASSIRLPDALIVEKLKEVVTLEPDFHGWYRYLYRKLRHMRRGSGQAFQNRIPGEDEKYACKKAYALRPDVGDNISNMANMLEEVLISSKKTLNEDEINEQVNLLVNLLKDSMHLIDDDPWTKVRLAEIYGFGNYQLDISQGEKIFKECIEKWPSNSMVWHKAGKFYHLGGNPRGRGRFMDLEKACEYYQRSLKVSPCNFPCLMDYLKLLGEQLNDLEKIITVIDEYLPSAKKENEFRKLLTVKGLILWMHSVNETERLRACTCWIELLDKFPNSVLEVSNSIKRKHVEIVGLLDINVEQVIMLLEKLNTADGSSRFKLVDALRNQNQYADVTAFVSRAQKNGNDSKPEKEVQQITKVSTNDEAVAAHVYRKEAAVYPSRGRGRGRGQTTRMSSGSINATEPVKDP